MNYNRSFIISFGDSSKYKVYFDGTKEEFESSEKLRDIKIKVNEYLKKKFPTGGYENVIEISVADDDGRQFVELDQVGIDELLKSVVRQVEVQREGMELNNNAPYDKM